MQRTWASATWTWMFPDGVRARRAMVLSLATLAPACGNDGGSGAVVDDAPPLGLTTVVSGLSSPVHLTAPAGDARLFIVEQVGRIRVVKNGQLVATPFLDLTAKVNAGGERGLLSVAFDPAFATNGHLFVYYTNRSGDVTVERYTASAGADVASVATATPVITIPHPSFSNHNGGLVAFGPDGMLYLGTGDGGGGGDPNGNGQNLLSLLGKLLRLDVRTLPYTIPASNPFMGQSSKRGEIWAYGLRNPWRYAWGPATDAAPVRLYIADVGQNAVEEIDVVRADSAGVNYGWNVMEGTSCYEPSSGCATAGLLLPRTQYTHARGCSIIGGYVYRGPIVALRGRYFYSDYCTGFVESIHAVGDRFERVAYDTPNVGNVLGFGEDAAGELYVLSSAGTVYRVVAGGG